MPHHDAPLQEILDEDTYPGNQAVYDRLIERLAEASAMAFVGAGASFPLYPLWGQLIGQLADEPIRRGLATKADKAYWLRKAGDKPLQMATQIHKKLDDPFYYTFLFETFKLKNGADGRAFTPAHAALMRAPFKAYLTTNYDPGLVEARRVVRPEIRDTSFAVWNQQFKMNAWASGDVFRSEQICPVLFAHGVADDPANIVLDRESYRRAYRPGPYRRFFENLWYQEHLVFVGFSFNDVTLAQIADEVLSETVRQEGSAPRHIAILGLPEDESYVAEMRHEYLDDFHAEVLFYPVRKTPEGYPDHSALQVLLDALAPETTSTVALPMPPSLDQIVTLPRASVSIPNRFVHETTEDEAFTGRVDALARLDSWAADPGVGLIAVTAIGGLGKTALVARWLRSNGQITTPTPDGQFFWSFYRDRSAQHFLETLVDFGQKDLGWTPAEADAASLDQALDLLRSHRVQVTLDGLEVIQEAPGTVAYGKLLDVELADFLHRHCRSEGASLVLLTSRFPFPDLMPHLGGSLRSLALPPLSSSEGAALLHTLGVLGEPADREAVSDKLAGHPMALRIFARSMPPNVGGDPTRLWDLIFAAPDLAAGALGGKMRRLLAFYEARLPDDHCQALGLLALFRTPVGVDTLASLWEGLLGRHDDAGTLRQTLDALRREHLLTVDSAEDGAPHYACHPILRDHFRAGILGQREFARQAADLLGDQPDASETRSLAAIQLVTIAIELLLEVGEIKAADDLYLSRLVGGRIFRWLPAPHWGMEVARGFVRDEVRRQVVKDQLGLRRLGFYLNGVALFAENAGEPETAVAFFREREILARKLEDDNNLSINLQNHGDVEVQLGLLGEAVVHFDEALALAEKINNDKRQRTSFAYQALAASLQGDVPSADTAFVKANAIENRTDSEGADLYSTDGVKWAEHLLRTGAVEQAQRLTEANRKICERNNWQEDVARCDWILGWLAARAERWPEARAHLRLARTTFTRGHMIYYLSRVLVTEAEALLGQGHADVAMVACERVLQLAAPRNYRLVHADALTVRARIWLAVAEAARARDDAEAALQLAEFCGYAWGQRDALELLATAYRRLGDEAHAFGFQQRADDWNRQLRRP